MKKNYFQISHILVTYQYEAQDLLSHLNAGRSFDELAAKYSRCPSSQQNGLLGPLDPKRMDPDFVEAASKLKPGEISSIVKTRFGYHLIKRQLDSD